MTNLPCGCDEKEVMIANLKYAIAYYEKDIEWVRVAQKRLDEALDEYIKSESKVDFFKDLLKYKSLLPIYLLICNRSVAECKKELERWENEQCTN